MPNCEVRCPQCGIGLPEDATFCLNCGTLLIDEYERRYGVPPLWCPQCQKPWPHILEECPLCHTPLGPCRAENEPRFFLSDRSRDVLYLCLLVGFSLFSGHRLFTSEFLFIGYQDWIYQAFRVKMLQNCGFTTWIHDWACGMPLFQSYQFIPHLGAVALVNLTGWSITKAMCVITGVMFVLFRPLMYASSRWLRLSPEASFVAALLTFDTCILLGHALEAYTYYWGVVFFPLILVFCFKATDLRWGYAAALVLGFSFYIHPYLGVVGAIALAISTLTI